jgi:hypothetical protein
MKSIALKLTSSLAAASRLTRAMTAPVFWGSRNPRAVATTLWLWGLAL